MSAIDSVLDASVNDLGGFSVRRLLPAGKKQAVGPFIFFDHMGPAPFPPGAAVDVRPHPHIGLSTVTYLFDGAVRHRDSLGVVQDILPGDVNWMTAGRGIVHSERSPEEARGTERTLHGIQLWAALPLEFEECDPSFRHHPGVTLPRFEENGARVTLVAGRAYGVASSVQTHGETLYSILEMAPGARIGVPEGYAERGVYVVDGNVAFDGEILAPARLALLKRNRGGTLTARSAARVLVIGGDPLDAHRHVWWNFVSSSRERLEEAKERWRLERFEPVPGETERIPLP